MSEQDLYRESKPPDAWRHAVVCCWEQCVLVDRVQRVVPDGCADLLVFQSGSSYVVGLANEVAYPVLKAGSKIQGIRFRPEALATLFKVDASTLLNTMVELTDVVGHRRAQQLADPAVVDTWIRRAAPDPRVTAAIALLREKPVRAVSDELGMSTRHLHRLLVSHTGLSPKVLQRVARFRQFLTYAERGDGLATAAAAAGYADQAHMSREVRRLTGLAPAALVRGQSA